MNISLRLLVLFGLATFGIHANTYLQPYAPYYSQSGQDQYLNEHVFNKKRKGVFVDVGAHDGISYSNTYYFEKKLGRTGICIEPHPDRYTNLRKNRKGQCYCACAGNVNGTVDFLKIDGAPEMLSGIYSLYDPIHLARMEQELAQDGGKATLITVPVRTLASIFKENNIFEIDFISIDVEGGELVVLQGIDFDACIIHYIVLENNGYPGVSNPINTLLASKGYKLFYSLQGNDFFRKIS